jgi:hypothetical protein
LCRCRIASASASVVPTGAVIRLGDVVLETQVAVGEDPDQPLRLVDDRHA